jgi:hypothetical protein
MGKSSASCAVVSPRGTEVSTNTEQLFFASAVEPPGKNQPRTKKCRRKKRGTAASRPVTCVFSFTLAVMGKGGFQPGSIVFSLRDFQKPIMPKTSRRNKTPQASAIS